MDDTDRLILRCREDPEAYRALVAAFGTRLFAFLSRLAGRQAAEDLFQETWLKVLEAAPRYEARGRGTAWLFTVASHAALNDLRRRARERGAEGEEAISALPDPGPGPAESALAGEAARGVERAVAELPFEQRQVFLLRELSGRPFKEIAAELGIPLGTALSRMNAALGKLRSALEDYRA